MPSEKYVLQADVKEMLSAQRAVIGQQSKMLTEMKRGTKATKNMKKGLLGMSKEAARTTIGMVGGFMSVSTVIEKTRDLIRGIREDLKSTASAAREIYQASGALYTMGGDVPGAIAEDWQTAIRQGLDVRELGRMRVQMTAAVPRAPMRQALMEQAREMRWILPEENLTDIALGLAAGQAAMGSSAEQAQQMALFVQRRGKGAYGQLAGYGGRAIGAATQLGLTNPEALALFAQATQAPGAPPEIAGTAVRNIVSRLGEQPWAELTELAGRRRAGEFGKVEARKMFGQESIAVALHLLKNWEETQAWRGEAESYLGGQVDYGRRGMRDFLADPANAEMVTINQLRGRVAYQKYRARTRALRLETADEYWNLAMEGLGEGWGPTWGKTKYYSARAYHAGFGRFFGMDFPYSQQALEHLNLKWRARQTPVEEGMPVPLVTPSEAYGVDVQQDVATPQQETRHLSLDEGEE